MPGFTVWLLRKTADAQRALGRPLTRGTSADVSAPVGASQAAVRVVKCAQGSHHGRAREPGVREGGFRPSGQRVHAGIHVQPQTQVSPPRWTFFSRKLPPDHVPGEIRYHFHLTWSGNVFRWYRSVIQGHLLLLSSPGPLWIPHWISKPAQTHLTLVKSNMLLVLKTMRHLCWGEPPAGAHSFDAFSRSNRLIPHENQKSTAVWVSTQHRDSGADRFLNQRCCGWLGVKHDVRQPGWMKMEVQVSSPHLCSLLKCKQI